MSWWALLLLGCAVAAALQLALSVVQLRTGKATIVGAGRVASLVALEERMLASHGDAYRRHQRRTSAFVPLPPREAA